ncbi:MAG: cell division protein FtsA [Halanaerobium sp.]|nr:cell division protein FtsA [Halanaerobium sp.]
MAAKEIITGLDIGTSKTCALIAQKSEEDLIEIIGVGIYPSSGLRKGIVVDIDDTVNTIQQAVKDAEHMAGMKISSVFVGIAGAHITSMVNQGIVTVTGEDGEISEADIDRVIEASRMFSLPPEREIIHVLPREFIVDDQEGIKDPLGMSGGRLRVESNIITGSRTSIHNLVKSVHRVGLDVEALVLQPLAAGEAVLSEDEKELGTIVVDIGGGTTDLAIFQNGNIIYSKVLPVGGDHVTNDIAVGLRTPFRNAEKIKIEYGLAMTGVVDQQEDIEVLNASGKGHRLVPRHYLCEIIEPRLVELFELVKREIEENGFDDIMPTGVVLTGGSSLLEGTLELASTVLGLPARLGSPDRVTGLVDYIDGEVYNLSGERLKVNPAIFSTGVGLIKYGYQTSTGTMVVEEEKKKSTYSEFFQRLTRWFKEFF